MQAKANDTVRKLEIALQVVRQVPSITKGWLAKDRTQEDK